MKKFIVFILPEIDCDFLNECTIHFDFLDRLSLSDSGWCDASTGYIILQENESIQFAVEKPEEELLLNLKFGSRMREVNSVN